MLLPPNPEMPSVQIMLSRLYPTPPSGMDADQAHASRQLRGIDQPPAV
jgi:hypothetical protein